MNKLIIMVSSVNENDRNNICNYIFCEYINVLLNKKKYIISGRGKNGSIIDLECNKTLVEDDINSLSLFYNAKIYSPFYTLQEIMIQLFGLDRMQCFGSELDKSMDCHVHWENIPDEIRLKYGRLRKGSLKKKMASGPMTAGELQYVFGTEICREIDKNCWSRALFSTIYREGFELAIINGCNDVNHASMAIERGAKVIHLLKGYDSKDASGEYNLVVDNNNLPIRMCLKKIDPYLTKWIREIK